MSTKRIEEIKAELRAAMERAISDVQTETGLTVRGVNIRFETITTFGEPPRIIVGAIDFDVSV